MAVYTLPDALQKRTFDFTALFAGRTGEICTLNLQPGDVFLLAGSQGTVLRSANVLAGVTDGSYVSLVCPVDGYWVVRFLSGVWTLT